MRKDPRVDIYIANAADFAQPILTHLRKLVHAAVPEVEETIKWGCPHYYYHGNVCAMASFKTHASFGFWKNSLVVPANKRPADSDAHGSFGRLQSLKDLPSAKELTAYIKKAAALNVAGVKAPQFANRKPRPALKAPPYLTAAIRKNARAAATWQSLPPSQKREYIDWVTGAKTDATRERRLATTVEWLAEGKRYNWKYTSKQ
ncbi:MAG: YdeI/OmpD-associated family protein [Gemmatimonadaceae bacterium]